MKISLITVTWNSASTVAHTLRSVNEQTHPEIEHLVIDGGSSDATIAIVRAEGRHVVEIVSEPDQGIYDAMNKGLAKATGDVVGLINSDDFYASPVALAKVAAAFANPDVDAVYADLCYVAKDDIGQIVRYWRSRPFEPGLFASGWAPPHPTLFVRRKFFAQFGNFDLSFPIAADMELMARFLEVHRLRSRHLPEVLVHMRTGGTTNRSVANIVQQNREIWRALNQHHLAASPLRFVFGKLLARGQQFIARPR